MARQATVESPPSPGTFGETLLPLGKSEATTGAENLDEAEPSPNSGGGIPRLSRFRASGRLLWPRNFRRYRRGPIGRGGISTGTFGRRWPVEPASQRATWKDRRIWVSVTSAKGSRSASLSRYSTVTKVPGRRRTTLRQATRRPLRSPRPVWLRYDAGNASQSPGPSRQRA